MGERPFGRINALVVTFTDTGEVLTLETKTGSANHFFPRFRVGDDEIQLRLDWLDLDNNGQPTLDADFIDPETGKHRSLKGERRDAHHTAVSPGKGRNYKWEFSGFSRQFSVAVRWGMSFSSSLSFTGSLFHRVNRKLGKIVIGMVLVALLLIVAIAVIE